MAIWCKLSPYQASAIHPMSHENCEKIVLFPLCLLPLVVSLPQQYRRVYGSRFLSWYLCPKVQSLGLKMGGYPVLKTLLLTATLTIYSLFDRSSYRGASVLALSILILLFLNVLIKISKTRSTLSLMFFAIPNWFIVNFQVSPLSLKFLVIFWEPA